MSKSRKEELEANLEARKRAQSEALKASVSSSSKKMDELIGKLEGVQAMLGAPLNKEQNDLIKKMNVVLQRRYDDLKKEISNPTAVEKEKLAVMSAVLDSLHNLRYAREVEQRANQRIAEAEVLIKNAEKTGSPKLLADAVSKLEAVKKEGGDLTSIRNASRNASGIGKVCESMLEKIDDKLQQTTDLAIKVKAALDQRPQQAPVQAASKQTQAAAPVQPPPKTSSVIPSRLMNAVDKLQSLQTKEGREKATDEMLNQIRRDMVKQPKNPQASTIRNAKVGQEAAQQAIKARAAGIRENNTPVVVAHESKKNRP